jgi:tetratricopeptide (TPR) repeat protein
MTPAVTLRIFLSSPGDVAEERALAEQVFQRLAKAYAGTVDLQLSVWEQEPLYAHAGFQEQIDRPSHCDLVVSILWSRLGSRLPAQFATRPDQPAPTGTEFEIEDALDGFRRNGRPHLLIYRKKAPPKVDIGSADAEERLRQYRDLDAFCRRIFYDAAGVARVAHHNFVDGFDFERRLREHVGKWLEQQLQAVGAATERRTWIGGSPFRGLQAFSEEYHDVFFGRSQSVGELIERIAAEESATAPEGTRSRLLLIQGMSGSGKTSLVYAGLLPLLRHRPIEGIAAWLIVSLRPSDIDGGQADAGCLGALAARLRDALPASANVAVSPLRLAAELRANPQAAVARIETYLAAEASSRGASPARVRLVVYVDQLEEAFSALPAAEGEALFAVMAALAGLPNAWVIATIRSDFIHRLEGFPALMARLRRSAPYLLQPPRGDELAEMIRGPASAAGLTFEVRNGVSLDRELLHDAEGRAEALPLLQYALELLYQRRDGNTLKWEVYQPTTGGEGGLRGALVTVAENTLEHAGADIDAPYRRVMRELTAVGEDVTATRRYASRAAFAPGTAERALLDRLIDARLCVTDVRGTEPVVYFAHEALLESWPRARQWLQQEAALVRARDELLTDARAWKKHAANDAWLGTAPEKLASFAQLERAGMLPQGIGAEYADRSRRRARRNRRVREGAVAAIAGLAAAAIIAFIVADQQRDRARVEASTADRTLRFLVSLFELADPNESRGNSVTVREVLDRGAREIGQGLEREPRVRADLLTAMGEAYTGLGLYEPAKKLLAQARTDQQGIDVPPESAVRTLIASGAQSYLAADYQGALPLLRRAVAIAQSKLPSDSGLTSEARNGLADVLVQLEQYQEAERLCAAGLRVDRRRGADGAPILARTLNTLASVYYSSGRLSEAEPPMREALELRRRSLGLRHPATAESMNNLASLLYQEGRYREAAAEWREALPVYRDVYGAEHPEVATLLNNLGRSALMAGRVDEAVPLLEQALQMDEKLKGVAHEDLVMPLNSLGMAYLYNGDAERARIDIERALQIARPRNHWMLDQILLNAADLELSTRHTPAAAELLGEARRQLEARYPLSKNPGADWRYAAWDAVNAGLLALENRADDARSSLARAREVLVRRFGPSGFYVLRLDQRAAAGHLTAAASRG